MTRRNSSLKRSFAIELLEPRQLLSATAVFLGVDTATEGHWSGAYGSDGHVIANTTASPPTYASVSTSGATTYTWASPTTDPRALQNPATLTTNAATVWYTSSSMTFDVDVTDGGTHKLSLYALDFDHQSRAETIALKDAGTGSVLDTESINTFDLGQYLAWNISGNVDVTVTRTAGVNAVVSGLFFDPTATVASPTNVQVLATPGAVNVTWSPAAPTSGTFNVYRTDSSGNTTEVASGVKATSYQDTSVQNGTTYTYAITDAIAGTESAPSASSNSTTPGGIWIPVLNSSGNPVSVTPNIMNDTVSEFAPGTALSAGIYRVDYTGGTMTYSYGFQGYRVNAFATYGDGFEVSQNGTVAPGTDVHTSGSEVQQSTPSGTFSTVTGTGFTFAGGSSSTLGVYLNDNPYSDNRAYTGLATPTFRLEEELNETSLTATDAVGGQSVTTPASSSPLVYLPDMTNGATLSLSTTTSPATIPTGYSEFYTVTGGGSTLSGTLTTGGSTSVIVPADMAENDLTIQTGIGPSTGTTFIAASQTVSATPLYETSLTAVDAGPFAAAPAVTTPSDSGPVYYVMDGSGNATLSLSTGTSATLPTGFAEFYEVDGGGTTLFASLPAGGTTVTIPAGMAGNPLTIKTGIAPVGSTALTAVSQTMGGTDGDCTASAVTISASASPPTGTSTVKSAAGPTGTTWTIDSITPTAGGGANNDFAQLAPGDTTTNTNSDTVQFTFQGAAPAAGASKTYSVHLISVDKHFQATVIITVNP